MDYTEILNTILKAIVNNPDQVRVTKTNDELGVLLTADCAKEDMGLVIGQSGSHAKSIRTIMRAIGLKNKARISFKINEPAPNNII